MINNDTEKTENLCMGCTACCEYLTVIIPTPETMKEIDRVKWYLLHNVHVFIDQNGAWKVDIPMKCTKLNNRGMCSIYGERPLLCREHSQQWCERSDHSPNINPLFTSVEELDEYLAQQAERIE